MRERKASGISKEGQAGGSDRLGTEMEEREEKDDRSIIHGALITQRPSAECCAYIISCVPYKSL